MRPFRLVLTLTWQSIDPPPPTPQAARNRPPDDTAPPCAAGEPRREAGRVTGWR